MQKKFSVPLDASNFYFNVKIVKLRDHPLLNGNWPPIWSQSTGNGKITVREEVGTLAHVHHYTGEYTKIFLVIEHQDQPFVGTLLFDDVAFSEQLATLLKEKIGRSIREIGDVDLSRLL